MKQETAARHAAQRRSVFPIPRFPVYRCLGIMLGMVRSPSPFLAVPLPLTFMALLIFFLARSLAFSRCSSSLYAFPATSFGKLCLCPGRLELRLRSLEAARSFFLDLPDSSTSMPSPSSSASILSSFLSLLLPRDSDMRRARLRAPMLSSKPSSSRCSSMERPRCDRSPRRPAPTVRGMVGWLMLRASLLSKRSLARFSRICES
mmetsp:Transcript_49415/g.120619  ORF Transcript_49415/g.120619 Transcript_49415/m.120619 type:complete len:204 (+) Transcript_49415:200-811(+)